jgi:hypothetical protein
VGDELSDAVLRIVKNNKGMVFDEVMSKVILTDEMRDFFVDVISDELIDYSNEYKINNHGLIPSDNSGSVMDDFILEIKAHSLWLNFYKYLNAESAKKISDRVGIKSDYHIFLGRRYEDGVDVSDYVSEELKSVTDSKFLESANYMELAIKGDFELRDVYYSRLIEIASGDMVGINVAAFLNSARRNLSVDEYKKVYSVLRNK